MDNIVERIVVSKVLDELGKGGVLVFPNSFDYINNKGYIARIINKVENNIKRILFSIKDESLREKTKEELGEGYDIDKGKGKLFNKRKEYKGELFDKSSFALNIRIGDDKFLKQLALIIRKLFKVNKILLVDNDSGKIFEV
jgi:hypothetical protein